MLGLNTHRIGSNSRFLARLVRCVLILVFCAVVLGLLILSRVADRTIPTLTTQINDATSSKCGVWNVLTDSKFDLDAPGGKANAVTVISKDDVWIVGQSFDRVQDNYQPHRNYVPGNYRPLFLHWDGRNLTSIPNTDSNFEAFYVELKDVSAVSTDDAWAVGYYVQVGEDKRGRSQPLTFHWDGKSWRFVPSPQTPEPKNGHRGGVLGEYNTLNAVSALSKDDVWAFGTYTDEDGMDRSLIEHWDGSQWKFVDSSTLGKFDETLRDAAVISANDIWVAGSYSVLHWDGNHWSIAQAFPSNSNKESRPTINSVTATDSSNIWAVGNNILSTFIERWNGRNWQVIDSPNPESMLSNNLLQVVAISANDVWAVGEKFQVLDQKSRRRAMALHWNGEKWDEIAAPNPSEDQSLRDVAVVSKDDIWAVGVSAPDDILEVPTNSLVAHWGACSSSTK